MIQSPQTLQEHQLEQFAKEIYTAFKSGVIILRGDLAAGKTTFVKAFVKMLGIKEDVTSPTFSLQQCYADGVFHYDIYNHGVTHFLSLGMLEELDKEGLHFVEWGDEMLEEILDDAGIAFLVIEIEKHQDSSRTYRINNAHA